MIVTDQGVLSVAEMLASNKTQQSQVAVDAKKVQQPISNAASLIGSIFGWQAYFCPQFNMFIVNIPSVTTEGNMQFAQNTINGGWCTFSGYDASHFVTFNKLPYFGAKDGKIYKAWYGNVDKTTQAGTGGTEILGKVQQSYSYLAAPAVQKQIGMYRPTFLVATDATYGSQVAYDFAFSTAPIVNAAPIQNTAVWDTGIWDTSYWAGELKAQRQWSQAEGMGTAISFVFTIRSRYETLWVGTDYTFKTGGVF